jgi:hypothetical protein
MLDFSSKDTCPSGDARAWKTPVLPHHPKVASVFSLPPHHPDMTSAILYSLCTRSLSAGYIPVYHVDYLATNHAETSFPRPCLSKQLYAAGARLWPLLSSHYCTYLFDVSFLN